MTVLVPISLPSVANLREHWATKARRTKAQRWAVALALRHELRGYRWLWSSTPGRHVTLTRCAPRPIKDEHDNLRIAFKAVADQIAEELGLDDGDPRLTWEYRQAVGKPPQIRITLEPWRCSERAL